MLWWQVLLMVLSQERRHSVSPSYAPGKVSRSSHTLAPVISFFWSFSFSTALEFWGETSAEILCRDMDGDMCLCPAPTLDGLTLVTPAVSCALFPMMLCCCWGQVCEPQRRTQHMFFLKLTDSEDWNSGWGTPAEEHLTRSYWPAEKRERL